MRDSISMKRLNLLFFVLALITFSCHLPPELEDAPHIEFNDLYFLEVPDTTAQPGTPPIYELVLDFDFEDGDGDIGLNNSFNDRKFQPFEYILDNSDTVQGQDNRIKYGSRPGLPEYNPKDYEIEFWLVNGKSTPKDTFLVMRNENYYNFFLNLYIKKNGEYEYYDPWENVKQSFNGRIPVIRDDVKATQGTIKYKWQSSNWPYFLPFDTVRIEFYIKDRQLHQSNTVSTPDFLIRELLQKKRR